MLSACSPPFRGRSQEQRLSCVAPVTFCLAVPKARVLDSALVCARCSSSVILAISWLLSPLSHKSCCPPCAPPRHLLFNGLRPRQRPLQSHANIHRSSHPTRQISQPFLVGDLVQINLRYCTRFTAVSASRVRCSVPCTSGSALALFLCRHLRLDCLAPAQAANSRSVPAEFSPAAAVWAVVPLPWTHFLLRPTSARARSRTRPLHLRHFFRKHCNLGSPPRILLRCLIELAAHPLALHFHPNRRLRSRAQALQVFAVSVKQAVAFIQPNGSLSRGTTESTSPTEARRQKPMQPDAAALVARASAASLFWFQSLNNTRTLEEFRLISIAAQQSAHLK